MITHRLSTIRNADYIYVLENGSVSEHGTHETLMTKEGGKYREMVERQEVERVNNKKADLIKMKGITEEVRQHTPLLTDGDASDVHKVRTRI